MKQLDFNIVSSIDTNKQQWHTDPKYVLRGEIKSYLLFMGRILSILDQNNTWQKHSIEYNNI